MVLLWLGIKPKTDGDREKLERGLAVLRDDPGLGTKTSSDGTVWLGAENEDQLEGAVDRLKREFDVEAAVTRPHVAYKEALTQSAEGEAKYVRQADGRGHYAHVKLRVSPGERGSGYVFENATIGLPIRGEFISAIEEGTRAGAEGGALAGYPIDDVRVIVCDGSYHDVDSSAQAFRHAARLAFDEAARKAQPVLLEPIMSVDVDVPAECEPVVSDGLLARRANMFGLFEDYPDAGTVRIAVTVPLAEMFGYRVELRERTRGRGTFAMSLSQYAPVTLAGEDGDPEAEVREPRKPRSPLKGLRASAPEPPDDSA